MVKEAMCSFEVAKLLKEAGFDEPCLRYFDTNTEDEDLDYVLRIWSNEVRVPNSKLLDTEYACCTHQMAERWLREVKKYHIEIRFTNISITDTLCLPRYYGIVWNLENGKWIWESTLVKEVSVGFKKYEDATDFTLLHFLQNLIKKERKDEENISEN